MLLIVGILFTSIIPLFMYVNQVNNYYDRTVVEMKTADQERSMEELEVYAYGHNQTGKAVDVFLVSRGAVSLNVTRIWVMRKDLQKTLLFSSANLSFLPLQLIASAQTTIENIPLTSIITDDQSVDYFNIEVATERGRKYSSKTNSLHRTATGWENGSPDFQIQVIVLSDKHDDRYKIEAVGADDATQSFHSVVESGKVAGDFFTIISVPTAGSYNVTAWKWQGGGYNSKVGDTTTILLTLTRPTTLIRFQDG